MVQIRVDGLDSFGPQRTDSFFVAFADDPHLQRGLPVYIAGLQINDLLNPGTGVIEQQQECIISCKAQTIIEVQKKLSEILEIPMGDPDKDKNS